MGETQGHRATQQWFRCGGKFSWTHCLSSGTFDDPQIRVWLYHQYWFFFHTLFLKPFSTSLTKNRTSVNLNGEEDPEEVMQHLKAVVELWWATSEPCGDRPAQLSRGADNTQAQKWWVRRPSSVSWFIQICCSKIFNKSFRNENSSFYSRWFQCFSIKMLTHSRCINKVYTFSRLRTRKSSALVAIINIQINQ